MTSITTTTITSSLTLLLSTSLSLLSSGFLLDHSLILLPLLQSQPAAVSLPQVQLFFARKSHNFPIAAAVAASGYMYLAYNAVANSTGRTRSSAGQGGWSLGIFSEPAVLANVGAAVCVLGIVAWTPMTMRPTSARLMEINEEIAGRDSGASARARSDVKVSDAEVKELLRTFSRLNLVRAGLLGVGGSLGLWGGMF